MRKKPKQPYESNLPAILEKTGVSRNELCRQLDIEAAYCSRLVSGHYNPRVTTAIAIAKVVGHSVEDIWGNLNFDKCRG